MATTTRYLSLKGVATYTGYSYSYIKSCWNEKRLPVADIELGGPKGRDDESGADTVRPGFSPATIDAWMDSGRPGQGARTDLAEQTEASAAAEPARYLSLPGVGTYTGYTYNTLKGYKKNKRLPDPDIELGGPEGHDDDPGADAVRPGFSVETIDTWRANRPGRGARTDLPPRQGTRDRDRVQ